MTPYIKPGVYRVSAADARKLLAVSKTKSEAAQRVQQFQRKNAELSNAARLRKFLFDSKSSETP